MSFFNHTMLQQQRRRRLRDLADYQEAEVIGDRTKRITKLHPRPPSKTPQAPKSIIEDVFDVAIEPKTTHPPALSPGVIGILFALALFGGLSIIALALVFLGFGMGWLPGL